MMQCRLVQSHPQQKNERLVRPHIESMLKSNKFVLFSVEELILLDYQLSMKKVMQTMAQILKVDEHSARY